MAQRKNMNMDFKSIGIWQTAFLGDAVLTLPLVHTLARNFPEADIHYFVRKGLGALFAPQPGIIIHEFDKHGNSRGLKGIREIAGQIRSMRLELWVSAHSSLRSALISSLSRPGLSIGYSRPVLNRLAYHTTVQRRFDQLDEIERLLELVRPLKPETTVTWPHLVLAEHDQDYARRFMDSNVRGKCVGIHPGSTWPTKMWPEEYFSQVINQMADWEDTQVILFAGPGEEPTVDRIMDKVRNRNSVINLAGRLSLPGLAAFISRLDCFISNDSGPMHLAWAQKVPLIAMFGPTTRSLGFFPRGPGSSVLETSLACRPCGLHGHKSCPENHHKCMRNILPGRVTALVREKLYA